MIKADDYSFRFYDEHGKDYIKNKREFYSDAVDTGRKYFRDVLSVCIQNKTLVDMGCGAGDCLDLYKKMGAARIIGIEPSSTMREEAKKTVAKTCSSVDLLAGQWNQIPLADRSVDIITAYYSLHVIQDFEKAFCEAARILKKDGLFLIGALHPIFDAKISQEQNLQPGEWMKIPIFDGKFIVEDPPHTMDEYFSKTCLDYFKVEEMVKYSMSEDAAEMEPSGLLLKLRRK